MMRSRICVLGLLVPALCWAVQAEEPAGPKETAGVKARNAIAYEGRHSLARFDKSYDLTRLKSNGGQGQLGGTEAAPVLRVTTPAGKGYPGLIARAPEGGWDLSNYQYISVDIHNVDTHDIDVFVRVDNPGANGQENCITERTGVQPDQRVTLNIPLKRVAHNSLVKLTGMQGYPQGLYPDKAGLDPSSIVALVFFTANTPTSNTFEVSNIYAAGRYETPTWLEMSKEQFFPLVDRYGQFIHKEWPGKIHSEAELQAARDAEAKAFAADAGPAEWDRWGGWAKGPKLQATGHFRVQKHEGKWWLVDPDGRLFFSTGITGVGLGWAATPIEDRDGWFAELPPRDEANKAFYRKSYQLGSGFYAGREPLMVDFSTINLQRKYGADWGKSYPAVVHQRLRAWGINTIGNWSDSGYCRMQRTPYTMTFFYNSRRLRGNFPDVFDPAFPGAVLAGAKQFLNGTTDDPWCIGYFLDNEMPWGGETALAEYTLKAAADQPAKVEMLRWLKERYATVADLNAAWGVQLASWDELAKSTKLAPKSPAGTKDLTEFTDRIADTYFRTVRQALKQVAPNKLYLGCRCVGGSANVIASAIKHCDVVSYNVYGHSVREMKFPGGLDGPILIGEFHFGASDRGLFSNGLVSADDQKDRARKYADYVHGALDNPQIVGVHWFQYGDEGVTGRGDGENAQCGFVDVCDSPYVETVQSSRAVAEGMYVRRMGGR